MKKNKNQSKKSYIKFLISKEAKQLEKKVQKLAIKEIKDINQTEINSLTKQIANSKHKINTLTDIMKNLENQYYLEMLGEQFQTMQEFEQFITKQLPSNMTIIQPSEGPKHLLIEDKIPLLKKEKQIYTYISDSIKEIVKDTQYYWNAFRIEEAINFQKDASVNNEKIIVNKAKEGLQTLLKTNKINLTCCVPPNCSKIYQVIETTIVQYTGNLYKQINPASSSKDILVLRGLKYLFQILIKNYRYKLFGTPLQNQILLYRNISLNQDLFKLYKKNSIIYFTHLTSTSSQSLGSFGACSNKDDVRVTFLITLLQQSEQVKNNFYSGLDIAKFSQFKHQKQVLLFPFQFFLITNITQKNSIHYQVSLQQIKTKAIIEKMQQPIKKNTKKCIFNKSALEEIIVKITHKEKSLIEEKITMKQSLISQYKSKLLSISGTEYIISKLCNWSNPKETDTISPPIKNAEIKQKQQKEQADIQQLKKTIINQILNQQQTKQIDQKVIEEIKKKQQAYLKNVIDSQKEKQTQKILKIQNIAKQCSSINEILSKLEENSQNLKQTYSVSKIEESFNKQILINKIIDTVSKEEQEESQKKLQKIQAQVKSNNFKFDDLKVANNVEVNNKEYVILVLQQAFKKVNQNTIILSSIPSSLYKFYVEKMTIGDINKFIYKFYYYASKSDKEIKDKIENLFKASFPQNGQYLKIHTQIEDKLFITSIESSQSYQQIYKIMKIVEQNEYLNLIKGSATVKSSNLIYCNQMLDKRGNNNYIIYNYPMQLRGHQDYHFPNGSLRIGLKVWDVYENNNWASMNGSPGQWPVIYTSFTQVTINESFYGLKNDNPVSAPFYPTISHKSINCCSDINLLSQYLPKVEVNGENIYLGFQCRVDPKELQYSLNNKKICYIDRSKSKSIRPYGIIMRKAL